MWKVEVNEYNYAINALTTHKKYFNNKESALEYCNLFKYSNADVYIQDMSFTDGECIDCEKQKYK